MSDERDVASEQEAQVARLLAHVRHQEPVPAEVAARLDQALEGLTREAGVATAGQTPSAPAPPLAPPPAPPTLAPPARPPQGRSPAQSPPEPRQPTPAVAPVIDLTARRRRGAGALLVAAAAIVVAGVGVSEWIDRGESSGAGDSAVEPPARPGDDNPDAGDTEAPPANRGVRPGGPVQEPTQPPETSTPEKLAPQQLNARTFAAGVERLRAAPGIPNLGGELSGSDLTADDDFVCDEADYGTGLLLPVYYDDMPAVLAFREQVGDTQTVELLQCGSAEPLRSLTISLS